MNAPVLQLHRPQGPVVELEGKLIGAALHLGPTAPILEAIGITGDEFSVELHAKAWRAVRRQAEAGVSVTLETVCVAGVRRKALTPEDCQALERATHTNTMTLEAFRHVAREFKLLVQGQRTAVALEAEAKAIRAGQFDPVVTAGRLSGIERELHRESAKVSDLRNDQTRLLERWDKHQREGTSDILATGIKVLDAEIGGLPQKLCLFAADAGVGKTALLDSMVHAMLLVHPTLRFGLISPEDGVEHLPKRWLARETGWLLREIGNRVKTREDEERLAEIAERNDALLGRVFGYRERTITGDGLISLCWQMVEVHGVRCVAIDNFNKIVLKGSDDYHERVQRFSDRLSEFAEKARVPAVLLAHTTGEEQTGRKGVSGSSGVQGGRSLGRDARLRIDLFRKDRELRGVICKANELGEGGTVIQFSRQATAGLIDPDSGEKIDVNAERRAERKSRDEERLLASEEHRERRLALRAAKKAPAPEAKPEDDQASLPIEVPRAP